MQSHTARHTARHTVQFLILLFLLLCGASALAMSGTVSYVVDGDTFVLESGEKVRLIGIDAPESQDPNKPVEYFSERSKGYLQHLISGQEVRLEFGDERTDKYGRLLCYVYVGDSIFANLEMIKKGYAMAYLRFPHAKEAEFLEAEISARRQAIGMWGSPRSSQAVEDIINDQLEQGLESTQQKQKQEQPASQSVTVYITKSGSKYHRGSCGYLRKSKIPISKDDAIDRGYGPCSRCRP